VAEGGTDSRGYCQHCADAGDDCDIDLAPLRRSALQCFAYCGSHSKHAGVAAGDDGHRLAVNGSHEGLLSALDLLPVVGRVTSLRRSFWHPVDVRTVSEQIVGATYDCFRFRRQLV
jgi:hypothetical protein